MEKSLLVGLTIVCIILMQIISDHTMKIDEIRSDIKNNDNEILQIQDELKQKQNKIKTTKPTNLINELFR